MTEDHPGVRIGGETSTVRVKVIRQSRPAFPRAGAILPWLFRHKAAVLAAEAAALAAWVALHWR